MKILRALFLAAFAFSAEGSQCPTAILSGIYWVDFPEASQSHPAYEGFTTFCKNWRNNLAVNPADCEQGYYLGVSWLNSVSEATIYEVRSLHPQVFGQRKQMVTTLLTSPDIHLGERMGLLSVTNSSDAMTAVFHSTDKGLSPRLFGENDDSESLNSAHGDLPWNLETISEDEFLFSPLGRSANPIKPAFRLERINFAELGLTVAGIVHNERGFPAEPPSTFSDDHQRSEKNLLWKKADISSISGRIISVLLKLDRSGEFFTVPVKILVEFNRPMSEVEIRQRLETTEFEMWPDSPGKSVSKLAALELSGAQILDLSNRLRGQLTSIGPQLRLLWMLGS